MFRRLERFAPQILGATRILVGTLLVCHGAQKLLGIFGGVPKDAPAAIVWIAGGIELTRAASFLMSGLMAFAYFIGHAPRGFWPILNGGELAIAYCWISLYIAAQGPGAWALENLRGSRDVAGLPARPSGSQP